MTGPRHPLVPVAGAATGIGSMPGTDLPEALRTVLGELPDLPFLPELPARGPGADMLGRTAAMLVDLHVDLQPSGWRLVDRPSLDERRGRRLLASDLDDLEEQADGFAGTFKIQVAGPWTLAALVEKFRGPRVVSDPGATRDVVQSLAEGVRGHVGEVRRRLPAATVVLQVDEPSLPAVLRGAVRTPSGFATVPPIEEPLVRGGLAEVVSAAGVPVAVHCCADDPPVATMISAGAGAISVDLRLLGTDRPGRFDEAIGEAVEAGAALWAGVVAAGAGGSSPADLSGGPVLSGGAASVAPVTRLWHRLGLDPGLLGERVVATPSCGSAGASPGAARAALRAAREAGRLLRDAPEAS